MQQVGNAIGVAVTGVIFFGALDGGFAHAFEVSLDPARAARARPSPCSRGSCRRARPRRERCAGYPPPMRARRLSPLAPMSDFCPGTTAVTGSPRPSTRLDEIAPQPPRPLRRQGGDDDLVEVALVHRAADGGERIGPTDERLDLALRRALQERDRDLHRPVGRLAAGGVGDEEGEGARPGLRAPGHLVQELRRRGGSVRHDQDPDGSEDAIGCLGRSNVQVPGPNVYGTGDGR